MSEKTKETANQLETIQSSIESSMATASFAMEQLINELKEIDSVDIEECPTCSYLFIPMDDKDDLYVSLGTKCTRCAAALMANAAFIARNAILAGRVEYGLALMTGISDADDCYGVKIEGSCEIDGASALKEWIDDCDDPDEKEWTNALLKFSKDFWKDRR